MNKETETPRPLWALLFCQCVLTAGLTLSFPFFALYLHVERGLPTAAVGSAYCLMLLLAGAAQSLGGELTDLWGPKRVMLGALAGRGAFMGLMAWAMAAGAPVWALIALHVGSGFAGNFFEPAIRSWVAERYPAERRVRAYALMRVAVNLGWAVGPALGGLIAARSYPLLFAVSSAVCAACLAFLRWGLEPADGVRARAGFRWRGALEPAADARFLDFCLLGALISAVMSQLVVSLSIHSVGVAGLSERQVGLLFGLNGLVVVLTQAPVTRGLGRLPITSALLAGCLLYALGYTGVGFARGFALMALSVVVVSLGEVVLSPGLHALAANLAPESLKGRYIGFYGLSHQLGMALGPLLGGLGLQFMSPRWAAGPWVLVGAMGTAAGLGFYGLRARLSRAEEGLGVP